MPLEKNLQTYDLKRLPTKVVQADTHVVDGGLHVRRQENVLLFGPRAVARRMRCCASPWELVRAGAAGAVHEVQLAGA